MKVFKLHYRYLLQRLCRGPLGLNLGSIADVQEGKKCKDQLINQSVPIGFFALTQGFMISNQ